MSTIKNVQKQAPILWGDGVGENGDVIYNMYDCPNCYKFYDLSSRKEYCPNCGQAFDWSVYEWLNEKEQYKYGEYKYE